MSRTSIYKKQALALLILGAVLGTGTACSTPGSDDEGNAPGAETEAVPDTDFVADITEAEVVAIINESNRLETELANAEDRITEECMQAKGHTIPQYLGAPSSEPMVVEEIYTPGIENSFIPTREDAETFGWGIGARQPELSGTPAAAAQVAAHEQSNQESSEAKKEAFADMQINPEFENKSPEQWTQYYEDLKGVEYMAYDNERMELSEDEWGTLEGVPYGGCMGEMIVAVYGEEALAATGASEGEGIDNEFAGYYRPIGKAAWNVDARTAYVKEASTESGTAFMTCLSGKGHEGWVLDDEGSIRPTYYWEAIHNGDSEEFEAEEVDSYAPIPADYPTDPAELLDLEIQMAIDFVDCNEESGFIASQDAASKQYEMNAYAAAEVEIFAAQEQMKEALVVAQEILEA